jgi:hypothetical protein
MHPTQSMPTAASTTNTTTPDDQIRELARDKTSLQLRCKALYDALNRAWNAKHIALVRGEAVLEPTLRVARTIEAAGRVPMIRFARDLTGHIIGIELAILETGKPTAEMAVVGEPLPAEPRVIDVIHALTADIVQRAEAQR